MATTIDIPAGLGGVHSSKPDDGDVSYGLLKQIADLSPALTMVVGASDWRILYANHAAHRAARTEDDNLVGTIVTAAFGFLDTARFAAAPQKCIPEGAVADRRDNRTVWWDVSCIALPASAPESARMLITAIDVTRHHAAGADADAEAAKDTLDALLAYIPQGISISRGSEVRVDRISAWGMALLGRQSDELTGRSALQQTDVWEVYKPGSNSPLSPAERPLARATHTGEVTMNQTLIVRRSNGDMLPVLCSSGPIRDRTGRVVGALMAWQDNSELQRAQAALNASNDRLRAVLLQIPAAILVVEAPDARIAFKSRLVDDLLGQPDYDLPRARSSLLGWAVHEDGTAYDLSEYPSRRALASGETVRGEPMKYRRGDGRFIDLEMHAGPVRDETGDIVAAVAVALDVTERHRAEAHLRASEQRLRLVMDSTRLGIWEYDPITGTTIHSARHDEILGYAAPQRDWSIERFVDHFPGPDRSRLQAALRAALEQGKEFELECRMIRADGSQGWLQVCGRPHSSERGSIIQLLGTVADITEHKKTESAAIETAAKFEVLAQTMPSMVWTSLPDGQIDWFNQRVSDYCGIPEAQMKPDGWSPVHPDDVEQSTRRWQEAVASGEPAGGLKILDAIDRVDLLVTDVGLPGGMNGRQLADAALASRPALKILFITGYAEHAVLGTGHLKPGMHLLTKPFSLDTLGSRVKEIIAAG